MYLIAACFEASTGRIQVIDINNLYSTSGSFKTPPYMRKCIIGYLPFADVEIKFQNNDTDFDL